MKRKFISAIILFAMALTMFATIACADEGDSGSTDTQIDGGTNENAPSETETEAVTSALSTIPVNNYDGYEFKIVSTNQNGRQVDVVAEELTGVVLNDLVFTRNMTIEEMYNIKIAAEDMDYGQINNMIIQNVAAGDNTYDMYLSNATAYNLATAGNLTALNNMPGIDIKNPWWDQAAIEGMSVGGNIYMVTGDITPMGLLTSDCVLFNKNLFDDNGMEYPYQTAFDGKWTLDVLKQYTTGLTRDLNGDGEIKDTDDLFSYTCWFDGAHAFFYGAGGRMVQKDSEDIPYMDWNLDRYASIFDKVHAVMVGEQGNFSTSNHEYSFKVFEEGRAYFCGIIFHKIEEFLRNMEDDYGVLPMPKYDENQQNYTTVVSGAGSMLVIPVTVSEAERTGNITEAMAAAAYDTITPSLYDVIASVKNVRDEESTKMVQIIIRSRTFDMAHMYYFAGDDYIYELLKNKTTDVASYFAVREKPAVKNLEKLVKSFLENNTAQS